MIVLAMFTLNVLHPGRLLGNAETWRMKREDSPADNLKLDDRLADRYVLRRAVDAAKDQSYFLFTLGQAELVAAREHRGYDIAPMMQRDGRLVRDNDLRAGVCPSKMPLGSTSVARMETRSSSGP